MRALRAARLEVWRRRDVAGVEVRVELAESGRAARCELRVEREALKTLLEIHRYDVQIPLRRSKIEIRRQVLAVIADGVQDSVHVADEEPPRARLVDEQHHPRSLAIDIGQ